MTISVNLLDDLELRCNELLQCIEDVRNDGSKHCGRLKRKTLDLNDIGVKIRKGER